MVYLPREEGQGLTEYGLILVLIAVVVVAALVLLGPEVADMYDRLRESLESFLG
ncbi:MAG: Flp family type IVb pilin [Anaerolineae bacterium]